MKTRLLLLLVLILSLNSGCKTVLPGNDPVVVRAQQTEQIAFTTFDTYVHIEDKYRATLWNASHDFKMVADKIRTDAPAWFKSFDAVLDAYKANRSQQNKANLAAGLATLEQAVIEAQGYLVRATQEGAKP